MSKFEVACAHEGLYMTMPQGDGTHINWCRRCGALRTGSMGWRHPSSHLSVSDEAGDGGGSLVDRAQEASSMSLNVLALRVANLVREHGTFKATVTGVVQAQSEESVRLSKLAERVSDLERDYDASRKRIVKHESLFMDFYKAIAQSLD